MIELTLKRINISEKSTTGALFLPDNVFGCFTLEDTVRNHKIPGKTAIPSGRYEIQINWSNRFQKMMPQLLDVPFYKGIRIHPGNTPANTEGCILVGRTFDRDFVGESRLAYDDLFPRLKDMLNYGKVFITIEGGFPAKDWVL